MIEILKLAARNLLRYKRRTLLTSLLITVGLTAVLLFVAVAGSFKSMMVAQFTDSMVGHVQVHRRGYVGAMESLPVDRNMRPRMLVKLNQVLDTAEGIEAWSPRVKLMAMFSNFANTTSIRLNGVDPSRELATVPLVANRVLQGGQVTPLVERGMIQVPELIAKGMKVKVGDTVVLVATNKAGSVNGKTFEVQGILESISGPGGRDGYIHIDDARDLLRIEDEEVEAEVLAQHGYVTLAPEPDEPDALKSAEPLKAPDPLKPDPLKTAPAPEPESDELELDLDSLLAGTSPGPPERAGYLAETRALYAANDWGRPSEVSEIAIRLKNPADQAKVLAELEGLERGPAGNTSLAAAFVIAQELDREQIIVVQETEYTGAGKHPIAQLNLARRMGVEVARGDPRDNRPGVRIVIPEHPAQLRVADVDLDHVRRSYLRNALASLPEHAQLSDVDIEFLAAETRRGRAFVEETIDELQAEAG